MINIITNATKAPANKNIIRFIKLSVEPRRILAVIIETNTFCLFIIISDKNGCVKNYEYGH